MFPCFFAGFLSRLPSSISSAEISRRRVSRGRITASTYPRSAATYGLANRSRNSYLLLARRCPYLMPAFLAQRALSCSRLFHHCCRSRPYTMLTAPSAPITAISAVGHAKFRSVRMCLELITQYAPPYALRVITSQLGHRGLGEGVEQFRAIANDAAVLLLHAGKKPGHILERDQRNVECVAEAHEARRLYTRIDVEHAGKKAG